MRWSRPLLLFPGALCTPRSAQAWARSCAETGRGPMDNPVQPLGVSKATSVGHRRPHWPASGWF
eukprot:16019832-Heterocapsa_arctica.AAC.1